jgi:uncharacterized coiled-coil DUF342 family protein
VYSEEKAYKMSRKPEHLDKAVLFEELHELKKKEEELQQKINEIETEIQRLKQHRTQLKSELNKVRKRIAELIYLIERT